MHERDIRVPLARISQKIGPDIHTDDLPGDPLQAVDGLSAAAGNVDREVDRNAGQVRYDFVVHRRWIGGSHLVILLVNFVKLLHVTGLGMPLRPPCYAKDPSGRFRGGIA